MPMLTSSVVNNIRNTHPLIPTRIPYYPSDPWLHGTVFIFPPDTRMFYEGLLRLDSTNVENFASESIGYESGVPFCFKETDGVSEDIQDAMDLTATNSEYFSGRHDPRILVKFKFTGNEDYEFWLGFADQIQLLNQFAGDPLGHSSLDPKSHGIGLYCNDNNFKIMCNDGTATSHFTADLDTFDETIHTFYLESDHANSRWGYSLDNAAIQYVTTSIPDPNAGLKLDAKIHNKASLSVAKRFTLYDLEAWQRKIPVS